jgi:ArsR family metal-binding transcriptional regulator
MIFEILTIVVTTGTLLSTVACNGAELLVEIWKTKRRGPTVDALHEIRGIIKEAHDKGSQLSFSSDNNSI